MFLELSNIHRIIFDLTFTSHEVRTYPVCSAADQMENDRQNDLLTELMTPDFPNRCKTGVRQPGNTNKHVLIFIIAAACKGRAVKHHQSMNC